jgi:hypothetical protein
MKPTSPIGQGGQDKSAEKKLAQKSESCSVLAVPFWLSCFGCSFLVVVCLLFCLGCSILAVFFWLSSPFCPALAVLL